ncbi:GTPase-activating protein GYP7 NDAI_0H03950 [Naumovozyma dairenensis CBS 421]|uniref:Rab-GAP TBC domain-containing protein n=1 Tax=Naumovozyma dairenensis (strain ATCC 10597 / BCRC 20456 / CBS 421 / NBRC 0211 / NRRL Y-12639) TaxID=1071378 RepID=G0WFK7_NAUDC|nr:hypothetical protein NDAI_0H03950 [Naumovozyma dairenensis CBS 421]CCD26568.1 hypothetical protein NDAI_0H03950 [Naumovozyma dairenensis CBS 421]
MSTTLLFCKSKVFTHATTNPADNIPGFLVITKSPEVSNKDSQISWIPENSLQPSQISWLNNQDMNFGKISSPTESTANLPSTTTNSNGATTIPLSILMNFNFQITISSLYSIECRPPSPNGWWYGSTILNLKDNNKIIQTLPILFFHDDICPSTISKKKELNKTFTPFINGGDMYYGAIDFKNSLAKLTDLQRTLVAPTVWLINPTLDDLRNFSPNTSAPDARVEGGDDTTSGSNSFFWNNVKWTVMSQIAEGTNKASSFISGLIRQHPVIKFIDQNKDKIPMDNPYVNSLLQNPKVQEIQEDFDSARIYLAKWALGVKNEAENYQIDESYRRLLMNELNEQDMAGAAAGGNDNFGFEIDMDFKFTDEELNNAIQRNFPLTRNKWDSFFDSQGRISITIDELKDYIVHGGIEINLNDDKNELRKEVWLFLLNVYPWDSSFDERSQIKETLNDSYLHLKTIAINKEYDDMIDATENKYWHDQIFRIEKDVKRNDRNIDIYEYNTIDGLPPSSANVNSDDDNTGESASDENEEGSDHWHIKNPHLLKLKDILITYNNFNPNLGYVQGMTDLLSPIYYIIRDESLTFWCFVNFMERMERNFLRDQSGIRDQMLTLTELCQLMLPKISKHLAKCDSSNLFFCFRMLLVWFKREFKFNDVISIWENFLTDYYCSQFQLFFILAILQKNSQPIIQNLNQFDQVIKYFNDLHDRMDWKDLMVRAELLFIKFKRIMDLSEHQKEQNVMLKGPDPSSSSSSGVSTGLERHRNANASAATNIDELNNESRRAETSNYPCDSKYLQLLLSRTVVIQKEGERTKEAVK